MAVYQQHGYRVRLEWGPDGLEVLAPECSVLVIVDVLSFTTAVDVAVRRGASVLPVRTDLGRVGAGPDAVAPDVVLASRDRAAGWSLSPSSLLSLPAGTRLALPSPNGATLSAAAAAHGAVVLAGCLRNASAVAAAALDLAAASPGVVGVVAAGERWRPHGRLRPALEDLLGAGAVITALGAANCSPEALAAAGAFDGAYRRGLGSQLAQCSSGRELIAGGFGADVELAAEFDVSQTVPVLGDGEYRA